MFPGRSKGSSPMRRYRAVRMSSLLSAFLAGMTGHAEAGQIHSLDGTWQIVFDRDNEGRESGWVRGERLPRARMRDITVPSCWD
jgi:hypothetical protein